MPDQLPTIQILIRSMDRDHLTTCVQSVLNQDYPNVELLVLNATGQKHRPLEIQSHFPITLLDPEGARSHARAPAANYLLAEATAPLLLFLDDDDELYPNHLSKLYDTLLEYPHAVAAYSGVLQCDNDHQTIMDAPWEPSRLFAINFLPLHAVLFRRSAIQAADISFDANLPLMEDWDFWLQLSQYGDFVHSPGVSAQYNIHHGQSSLSANRDARLAETAHAQILNKWLAKSSTQRQITRGIFWLDGNYILIQRKLHNLEASIEEKTRQQRRLEKALDSCNKECERLSYDHQILHWYLEHLPNSTPMVKVPSAEDIHSDQLRHVRKPLLATSQISSMIDVIIPAYKGLDETQKCINSVLKSTNTTPHRLIILNDASPEPALTTWLQAISKHPLIKLVENTENLGFAATANKGMQMSNQNDVLLLNSDTEVAHDWIDRLQSLAHQDAAIGTVTPFSNNATICSYPRFCEDNELPQGLSFQNLDKLFAENLSPKHSIFPPP